MADAKENALRALRAQTCRYPDVIAPADDVLARLTNGPSLTAAMAARDWTLRRRDGGYTANCVTALEVALTLLCALARRQAAAADPAVPWEELGWPNAIQLYLEHRAFVAPALAIAELTLDMSRRSERAFAAAGLGDGDDARRHAVRTRRLAQFVRELSRRIAMPAASAGGIKVGHGVRIRTRRR